MSSRKRADFSIRNLQRELHRSQVGRKQDSLEVIKKHARLTSSNKPMRCTASRASRDSGDPLEMHSLNKVIFDSPEAARACAAELRELYPEDEQTYVYRCARSKHGHVHLTTRRRADNLPEPEVT